MGGLRSRGGRGDHDELIILPSLRAKRGSGGGLILTQKFLDGVAEYCKSWPGRVTVMVSLSEELTGDMDHVEVFESRGHYAIEVRPAQIGALKQRLRHAAVVLAFLSPFELRTARLCRQIDVPLVFVSEYTLKTERQIIDAEVPNLFRRLRRKIWLVGAERKRLKALALASGVQCSGVPSYQAYRQHNPNAMLFFDNRVPAAAVIGAKALEARLTRLASNEPLRLVFGGRLSHMKGAAELPQVAMELKRLGVAFSLDIYGDGPLRGAIMQDIRQLGLSDCVRIHGVKNFHAEWVPLMRLQADLFICCHVQSDPSSTYPEVMSCGVPIVGYDNDAFAGIVGASRSGWLCPMGSPRRMAAELHRLDGRRDEIAESSRLALQFGIANHFEATFSARVAHLIAASQSVCRSMTRATTSAVVV